MENRSSDIERADPVVDDVDAEEAEGAAEDATMISSSSISTSNMDGQSLFIRIIARLSRPWRRRLFSCLSIRPPFLSADSEGSMSVAEADCCEDKTSADVTPPLEQAINVGEASEINFGSEAVLSGH